MNNDRAHSSSGLVDNVAYVEDNAMAELVNHYVEDLSSIFFLGDGSGDNPMFRYVLPLMNSVPPVRFAIAASASCHMAARKSDEALGRQSLYLRVRATHFLRERLENPTIATNQATLASILMLAQVDMCSGDCIEFETHLKAAVAIIRGRHSDDSLNRYYFEQRLTWLDVISSTSSSRALNFTAKEIKVTLERHSNANGREWSYDVFPCPIDLFEMLVDVTLLYKSHPNRDYPTEGDLKYVENMMNRLKNWEYAQILSGPRKHMVEGWRFGIMAYLERLFPSSNMVQLEQVTSQVIHHAKLVPPASSWSYSLLWPIFQAGVSLGHEGQQEKAWMRSRLKLAYEAVGCHHFVNALETLELVWNKRIKGEPVTNGMYGRTIMLG
ncbi:unnamed protein product [Clonostachys rosea]|uniref:Transcription factor domain-containing protein n=1 Tax=Bionectria ochroleuca TaxID=29856 RepID=A0ABY6UW67_BIOOC|nr:unnamed protein product [Clonostachys rosea]